MTKKYTIKPFVWEERIITEKNIEHYTLPTRLCNFFIYSETNIHGDKLYNWSYCIDEYYDEDSGRCSSLEEAKKLMEQEVLSRILPFLEEVQ